jgi:hypothetical protein
MAIDATSFVQWTVRAGLALFAIVAGFYISPWLGGASFVLAVLFWLAVLLGVLYAAEVMPWIDRIEFLSRPFRFYATPFTSDEKQRLRQLAQQREEILRWQDAKEDEATAREQKMRRFFDRD